ncbi:Kalirin [Manis pentadactyla]|nr:Kalirin [Manis pentadactyla]
MMVKGRREGKQIFKRASGCHLGLPVEKLSPRIPFRMTVLLTGPIVSRGAPIQILPRCSERSGPDIPEILIICFGFLVLQEIKEKQLPDK